jgi:hypothetical protein
MEQGDDRPDIAVKPDLGAMTRDAMGYIISAGGNGLSAKIV